VQRADPAYGSAFVSFTTHRHLRVAATRSVLRPTIRQSDEGPSGEPHCRQGTRRAVLDALQATQQYCVTRELDAFLRERLPK
jgi:hypothetical protein